MKQLKAVIGGEEVETGSWMPVIDPATGEPFAEVAECGEAEVDAAVGAAREALPGWRSRPPRERSALLLELSKLIARDAQELARLESTDTGKPLSQALADVNVASRYFEFCSQGLVAITGETIPVGPERFAFTIREPHGVTGHIIPWNYPIQIACRTIAPALAMGNCCVLKGAEEAPVTPTALGRLALEAGFPPGVLNVLVGRGETAGAALASHPGIGHLSFTGSREVGVLVTQAAARNIVPTALELGGKSPQVVFADAALPTALETVVKALLQNAGQTCTAGTRLLVERKVQAEAVETLAGAFASASVGPGIEDPDLGPLISARQRDRVTGFVERAREDASLVTGGSPIAERDPGFFFEPTIFDDVPPEAEIAQEEIFGPVLSVIPFDDVDHAIELANVTDYGLNAGVWTADLAAAQEMVAGIEAGQVYVNGYGAGGGVELPFGGYKASGFGREKGLEAMLHYTQTKTVSFER